MAKSRAHIKKVIRSIHLWLGLLSGIILSIVGITGSVYVFEPEISAYLEKDIYQRQGTANRFSSEVEMATYVENEARRKIESIQWPKRGRDTFVFKFFEDENWYFFDPSTGNLSSGYTGLGNEVFAFILDLHTTLTLGETGRIITGVASLLFTFAILTTGLYLWWPNNKGRRKSSFRIKWSAKPKRLNYDLHNISGFYFFLPLFLLGFTGAAFYFDDEVQWLVDRVTFSEPAPESIFEMQSQPRNSLANYLTVQEVLVEMDRHFPNLHKRNLWMTRELDGALSLAYQSRTDVHSGADTRVFMRLDPVTATVLGTYDPEKLPRGASLMAKWHLPVHFGEFGGLFTRILWFVAGLLPAFLTYTGIKIWVGKRQKGTFRLKKN